MKILHERTDRTLRVRDDRATVAVSLSYAHVAANPGRCRLPGRAPKGPGTRHGEGARLVRFCRPGPPPWQSELVAGTEAAFFDLDKTVIAKASVVAFSRQFYREGLVTRRVLAQGLWAQVMFLRFGAKAKTLERLRHKMLRLTAGWEQEKVRSIVAETLAQVVGPITYRDALDLIDEHKRAGRRVYIVSAAPAEIVEPLADYLGAEEAIASQAAVNSGRYTGHLLSYTYGPQKAEVIRQIAERDGLDLPNSWAYSDSATDLPMLEAVGNPVAVNPDRALRRIARMKNWPVMTFTELAVVTPSGHRPLRVGLAGAAGAMLMGAVVMGIAVVARRHTTAAPAEA